MVKSLKQANENIQQSRSFYLQYIKDQVKIHGNNNLCRLLKEAEIKKNPDKFNGVFDDELSRFKFPSKIPDRSKINKAIKRGSIGALYRLANEIHEVIQKET